VIGAWLSREGVKRSVAPCSSCGARQAQEMEELLPAEFDDGTIAER